MKHPFRNAIIGSAVTLATLLGGCAGVVKPSYEQQFFSRDKVVMQEQKQSPTQTTQTSEKPIKKKNTFKQYALVDENGNNSTTYFIHETDSDNPVKTQVVHETFQNSDSNTGLDISNEDWRLNLGYGKRQDPKGIEDFDDPYRVLITKKFEKGFIGGKFQHLPDEDYYSLHGGLELNDKNSIEVMLGDTGASGILFHTLDNESKGIVGLGGGMSKEGEYDGNISYGDKNKFAYARFGKNRNVDLRLAFGNLNPNKIKYLMGVTGSGFNERDDFYDDITFRYGIGENGRIWIPFSDTDSYLGEKVGSRALHLRLNEGKYAKVEGSYRATERLVLTAGIRAELQENSSSNLENTGVLGRIKYDLGSHFGLEKDTLNTYLNGYVNNEGDVQSAIGMSFIRSF